MIRFSCTQIQEEKKPTEENLDLIFENLKSIGLIIQAIKSDISKSDFKVVMNSLIQCIFSNILLYIFEFSCLFLKEAKGKFC